MNKKMKMSWTGIMIEIMYVLVTNKIIKSLTLKFLNSFSKIDICVVFHFQFKDSSFNILAIILLTYLKMQVPIKIIIFYILKYLLTKHYVNTIITSQ